MKVIVSAADMRISSRPGDEIITYALGSCLGITIYDAAAGVGGMLHVMLPLSSLDPAKAEENPFMFVDTGVPRLFLESYKAGAVKHRLEVKVAGGACANGSKENDYFQIGKRNITMLRKLLWTNGVLLKSADVAGTYSRTLSLNIATGQVTIKSNGIIHEL